MKNYNDTIGNRTRDLPACGAVPQATALPRAPNLSTRPQLYFHPLWVILSECTSIFVRNVDHKYIKKFQILLKPFHVFRT